MCVRPTIRCACWICTLLCHRGIFFEITPAKTMIKISVMYPYSPEARFDLDYYCNVHMPLVKSRMGARCLRYEVDKCVRGRAPGSAPAYVAIAHIYCASMD